MVDRFVVTQRSGCLGQIGGAVVAVPIGLLMFLASFVVLYLVEGRTNESELAAESTVASAEGGAADGAFVSVTGTVEATEPLGDPELMGPGPWLVVQREVEAYAWVERSESRERRKTGGGSTRTTTYTYDLEWTDDVEPSSSFAEPTGHDNPVPAFAEAGFVAAGARLGAWSFDPKEAKLPRADEVIGFAGTVLKGPAKDGVARGDQLYLAPADPDAPKVGDLRVRFKGLASGLRGTAFGAVEGGRLVPAVVDGHRIFRVLRGGREEALVTLQGEYEALGWAGRVGGFFLMWIGMLMVLAPLHEVADVIPLLGSASRGIVLFATFPIALALTTVTVVLSMILHSVVALVAIGVLILGWATWVLKKRKAAKA